MKLTSTLLYPLIVLFVITACTHPKQLKDHTVVEPYHPKQKIDFPHDIHSGKNGIDCTYCHNPAMRDSTSDLQLTDKNICLNCHKSVNSKQIGAYFQEE
jgi:predicted CXXCH cytochrome family protein